MCVLQRVGLLVMLCVALSEPITLRGQQQQPPQVSDKTPNPRTMIESKLQVSRKALANIERANSLGVPVPGQPSAVYVWSIREVGSLIYLSMRDDESPTEDPEIYFVNPTVAPSDERLAAFERHLARMKVWEERQRPLVDQGQLSNIAFLEYQFYRVQAETWLSREKAKRAATAQKP